MDQQDITRVSRLTAVVPDRSLYSWSWIWTSPRASVDVSADPRDERQEAERCFDLVISTMTAESRDA